VAAKTTAAPWVGRMRMEKLLLGMNELVTA